MGKLIDRVVATPLAVIPLAAGDVMHAMKSSSPGYAGFGEAYFSCLVPGAMKGWKKHSRMTLNLVVPVGVVRFGIVDADTQEARLYQLGPQNYVRLTVPPGLWMAFRSGSSETSIVLNLADIEHDPSEAETLAQDAVPFDWTAPMWGAGSEQVPTS
ncbi:MAG: dTDP-4-dehydrorhamnose 3,5-epimerase [Pseudolabrys sp.]|nr:dTDP-4-dehydrorhamnose 3,5-epimerase [Pseudolabrys sp.]